jgi:hypothetical protein
MKVWFYPERQQPIARQAPYTLDSVRLLPGENNLSENQYKQVSDLEAYQQLLEQGAVVEEEGKKQQKRKRTSQQQQQEMSTNATTKSET